MAEAAIRPIEFYVLLVLADADAHGYAIIQQIEERTQGDVRLQPGTLYRALDRLVRTGLVRSVGNARERGTTQRKVYTLTDTGRESAQAEARRLNRLVQEADASGLIGEPES